MDRMPPCPSPQITGVSYAALLSDMLLQMTGLLDVIEFFLVLLYCATLLLSWCLTMFRSYSLGRRGVVPGFR
jgi:ABC-type multidrug transport system permease subunit